MTGDRGGAAVRLDAGSRQEALRQMAGQQLDVLVIGGGVVGAGAALDAVTRGLRVGLVEARDYASGTSSRSSKLVHGGLRYLEQLDFGLVREALRERSSDAQPARAAPGSTGAFLYPLRHRVWERFYVGSGVLLYDTMGGRKGVPSHRHLTRRQALREFPSMRKDALVGAIRYYDGQLDDARHTMMLARTAADYGAFCATSARMTGFLREGDRVSGARVKDLESGEEIEIRARQTINAAGVWTDEIQEMVGGRGQINVRASKGVHLVVPRDRIRASTGIISRTEKSVLFIIPWGEHWIIGTTDTDWTLDLAHPAASRTDVDYLIDHTNRLLQTPITHDDVVGVYAGLRPLLFGESEDTSQLSREHAVVSPVRGLVMVAGGKYTTYRVMAKDAVDAVAHGLPGKVPPSCTDTTPLVGCRGLCGSLEPTRAARDALRPAPGPDRAPAAAVRVAHARAARAGRRAARARGAAAGRALVPRRRGLLRGPGRRRPAPRRHPDQAHPDLDRGGGPRDVRRRRGGRLVAPLLGWTDAQAKHEVEHYRARVEAEHGLPATARRPHR